MRFSNQAVVLSVLTAAFLVPACGAHADFAVPDGSNFPWTRGSTSNSAFAQWEVFTSPAGPNLPDAGSFVGGTLATGAPAWNVYDTSGTAFVTSGGNIYSFAAPTSMRVTVPNFGYGESYSTTIVLQVRTQGNEILPSTVQIDGVAPTTTTELLREALGGFGGALVDTQFRWELTGNAASYEIRFDASASSMSTDRVAIDTFTTIACRADINASGAVTVQDIFDFLAAYFANLPISDINASGEISVQDIFDFLALYFAGCD